MGWVRARRRPAGWLALVALAVQLTLSFGHIHAEDFQKDAAPPSLNVTAVHTDPAPATPAPDHDDCPICVAAHLTGAAAPPEPPQVAVPVAIAFAWRAAIERGIDQPAMRQPFQARAPPQA
jgi:hypothetical protein